MSKPDRTSRRSFIKSASFLGAASAMSATQVAKGQTVAPPQKAKNLIFLVVDGMCSGTLGLAHHWNLQNKKQPLEWMKLFERPDVRRSLQDTASASSPVTDSAAASSAWGCGQRVNNGSINMDASAQPLTPLFSHAKAAGKATGLVTTCHVTHATPSGFAANALHRNFEDEIAKQYCEREIDVVLGGGRYFFQRDAVPEHQATEFHSQVTSFDRISDFKKKGYTFLETKEDLLTYVGNRRLLGLFSQKHIPYAIDRKNDPNLSHVPSLPEMFSAALTSLSTAKNGFVLQVEGGRVDHAGHANDPAAILHEMLEFDACIPMAMEFMAQNPDTLVIVTTDHGTGGCQLNGLGFGYVDSGPALTRINRYTSSFQALGEYFTKTGTFYPHFFEMMTGLVLTPEQQAIIQAEIDLPTKPYLSSVMTSVVAKNLFQDTGVGWTSNNHTSECVDLFAFGPGSETVPAFLKNHELFDIMVDALGLQV